MHERTGMAVFAYISPKDWSTREGCQAIYFFFCFYFCMEQAFPVFVPRYDSSHTYRHRSSNPMVCILECAAWASIAHVLDLNVLHHTHTHTVAWTASSKYRTSRIQTDRPGIWRRFWLKRTKGTKRREGWTEMESTAKGGHLKPQNSVWFIYLIFFLNSIFRWIKIGPGRYNHHHHRCHRL